MVGVINNITTWRPFCPCAHWRLLSSPKERGNESGVSVLCIGLPGDSWNCKVLLQPWRLCTARLRPWFVSPSVLPSTIRQSKCIPWFGKRAELLGAVLSNSWNTGESRTSCFCFQFWPCLRGLGCHWLGCTQSPQSEQWGWCVLASWEYCSGYLWELSACGRLKCVAAG